MTTALNVTYRDYLEREYEARRNRNPAYSMRAFAKGIGIAPPKLSQILHGTCGLSREAAIRVASKLHLAETETRYFVALVELEHSRSKVGKRQARILLDEMRNQSFGELDLERFRIIADWYHFSILELTEVADFQSDPNWIANRLGITVSTAKSSIQRLLDHGLLSVNTEGQLRQTDAQLATPNEIPSRELRMHHSQILRKAEQALESIPVDGREFSSSTFAIDTSKLQEAKNALRDFRRKFCKELQDGASKDRVYCLAIQLFPTDQTD